MDVLFIIGFALAGAVIVGCLVMRARDAVREDAKEPVALSLWDTQELRGRGGP